MHVGRQLLVGISDEEAAQLLGELELSAAATANAQVLLDRGALCLADEPVEVVPHSSRTASAQLITGPAPSACRWPPRAARSNALRAQGVHRFRQTQVRCQGRYQPRDTSPTQASPGG